MNCPNNNRELIIDQMKKYREFGLLMFPKGPTTGLDYPEGLSVEDWAYSIAMSFVECCAKQINKSLTEKYFTGSGIGTLALLDALGPDGIIIGASVFRIIDYLIFKLPSNDVPNKCVAHNNGSPDPLQNFMQYLFNDDQSIREHCQDYSEEIHLKYKFNDGDNSPLLAEFLLSLIDTNSDSLELSLTILRAILQEMSIKQMLIESIQMYENFERSGCFEKKGLEGIILILNLILDEVKKLNIN